LSGAQLSGAYLIAAPRISISPKHMAGYTVNLPPRLLLIDQNPARGITCLIAYDSAMEAIMFSSLFSDLSDTHR
jgi:hypothetical protein